MMRATYVLAITFALGCDVPPLSHEQLFGSAVSGEHDGGAPPADAGRGPEADRSPATPAADSSVPPPSADAAASAADAPRSASADAAPECQPTNRNGILSGVVVDACDRNVLDAFVGIAGKHTCSFSAKGSFFIDGLPVGCALTLTARKDGYELYSESIVISSSGTANVRIELKRQGGCTGPAPPMTACRCDQQGCV